MKKLSAVLLVLAFSCGLAAQVRRDVAGGTVLGAIAGAVIGNNTGHGNGARGAAIGAGVGAVAGLVHGQDRVISQYERRGYGYGRPAMDVSSLDAEIRRAEMEASAAQIRADEIRNAYEHAQSVANEARDRLYNLTEARNRLEAARR
jgi:hypothetical protein